MIKDIQKDIERIKLQNASLGVKYEEILEAILNPEANVKKAEKEEILRRLSDSTRLILTHYLSEEEFQMINTFLEKTMDSLKNKNNGLIIKKLPLWKRCWNIAKELFNRNKKVDSEKKVFECELPPENVLRNIYNEYYISKGGYPLSDYVLAKRSIDVIPYILTSTQNENDTFIGFQYKVINPNTGEIIDGSFTSEFMCTCPSISPRIMETIEIKTKDTCEDIKYIPYPKDIVALSNQQKATLVPLKIRGLEGQYFYDEDNNSVYKKDKTCPIECRLSDYDFYPFQSEIYIKVELIPFVKKQYEGKVMWVAKQPVFSGIPYINGKIYEKEAKENEFYRFQNSVVRRNRLINSLVINNYLNGTFLTEVKELADICREKNIFGDKRDSVRNNFKGEILEGTIDDYMKVNNSYFSYHSYPGEGENR